MHYSGLFGFALITTVFMASLQAGSAGAVGICKCDSEKGFENTCLSICKEANERTSFFRPAVYFGDDPKVNTDATPLNGTSMKYLYMSKPTRQGMESFRKFLERGRKIAENEFKQIRQAYLRGHVGPEEFNLAAKRRDEAVVNYQHGMRAYLNTPTPR